jgi:hypothetical protein
MARTSAGTQRRCYTAIGGQPDHVVPVYALCHSAPSVPCTKMSARPGPDEQAASHVPAAIWPPRDCQPDHDVPSQSLYQTAPSVPRTKTSIRLLPGEVAAGADVRTPPRGCQLVHDVPSRVLCHRWPSEPCTKTSV